MLLATSTAASYLSGPPEGRTTLELGGKPYAQLTFQNLAGPAGTDGCIGTDVLQHTAVGIDLLKGEITFWPGGNVSKSTGEGWIRGLPEWGGPVKVKQIPAKRLKYGGLTLDCMIGDKKTPLGLRLAFFGSMLEPSIEPENLIVGSSSGLSLLPSFAVAGLSKAPAVYQPVKEKAIDRVFFGAGGTVSLDQFGSRRILIDFAAGTIFAEDLGEDRRLSLFVRQMLRLPMNVMGSRVTIEELIPNQPQFPQLAAYLGSSVVEIDGAPVEQWLADLRGKDNDAGKRLAERLKGIQGNFDVLIRTSDGNELPLHIQGP